MYRSEYFQRTENIAGVKVSNIKAAWLKASTEIPLGYAIPGPHAGCTYDHIYKEGAIQLTLADPPLARNHQDRSDAEHVQVDTIANIVWLAQLTPWQHET
jgi:hypothetical protein